MNFTSRFALLAAFGVAIAAVTPAAPVFAKKAAEPAGPPAPKLSEGAMKALQPVQEAINKKDAAGAQAALDKGRAALKTPDDQYVGAQMALNIAQVSGDQTKLASALDELITTGEAANRLTNEDRAKFYGFQGRFAYQAQNYPKAEQALTKAIAAGANDGEAFAILADSEMRQNKNGEAAATMQKAVDTEVAGGKTPPASYFELGSNAAAVGGLVDPYVKLSQGWLASYPAKKTWATVLNNYRAVGKLAVGPDTELLRLARASGALPLMSERDYNDYFLAIYRAYPNEAAEVIKEGVAAGKIHMESNRDARELLPVSEGKIAADKASLPAAMTAAHGPKADFKSVMSTADVFYGYKDFAKASELYKLALTKPGADANLVNLRLGASLAQGGDKAGSLAALANVTAKPYADIAGFWKVWVEHPAAS
jgi:hypothetical protein